MKKIKLAVLAVCLLAGMVGAYGTSKKTINLYYVQANTPKTALTAIVSASSPTLTCSGGTTYQYLCRFSTGESYMPGDEVWLTEVTLISTYNQ